MALSNIFREPRREIMESAVGLAVVVLALPLDYALARWFEEITGGSGRGGCPWQLGMILCPILFAVVAGFTIVGTHNLGEAICDALERRGLRLRPHRRC